MKPKIGATTVNLSEHLALVDEVLDLLSSLSEKQVQQIVAPYDSFVRIWKIAKAGGTVEAKSALGDYPLPVLLALKSSIETILEEQEELEEK